MTSSQMSVPLSHSDSVTHRQHPALLTSFLLIILTFFSPITCGGEAIDDATYSSQAPSSPSSSSSSPSPSSCAHPGVSTSAGADDTCGAAATTNVESDSVVELQRRIQNLQKENEKLREALQRIATVTANHSPSAAAAAASALTASTQPITAVSTPTNNPSSSSSSSRRCIHPPHFSFEPSPRDSLPEYRSSGHRRLTDARGLTLSLEWVRRGTRGWFGDAPRVAELTKIPSPTEFIRDYVSLSRPFIVRGGVRSWSAFSKWTDEYLASSLRGIPVRVRRDREGDGVFHYDRRAEMIDMKFEQFVEALKQHAKSSESEPETKQRQKSQQSGSKATPPPSNVNDRFDSRRLYLAQSPLVWSGRPALLHKLCADLEGRCPQPKFSQGLDAKHINLWYGRGNKTVQLHYDNNEGLMAMFSGTKRFQLFSPSNRNYLYPTISSERSAISSLIPDAQVAGLESLDEERFPCFKHAVPRSTIVEVREGDLFYLPAYWWHRVHSYGRSLGINWWLSTHSMLLQQIMKTVDLNVDVREENGKDRKQKRW